MLLFSSVLLKTVILKLMECLINKLGTHWKALVIRTNPYSSTPLRSSTISSQSGSVGSLATVLSFIHKAFSSVIQIDLSFLKGMVLLLLCLNFLFTSLRSPTSPPPPTYSQYLKAQRSNYTDSKIPALKAALLLEQPFVLALLCHITHILHCLSCLFSDLDKILIISN